MVSLSYHLSEIIQENLNLINQLRTKTLLTPIKPMSELRLRWEANINKTYWGLALADNPLSKLQMSKLMSTPIPKKVTSYQKEVISYMNTLKLIREYWTGSKTPITAKHILEIYDFSCKSVFGSTLSYFKSKEEEVNKILDFLEHGKDHPVIKAGLLQIEVTKLSPFENGTGRVARLLSHLILSKYGYDLRGLLILEDYYRNDLVSLKEAVNSIEKDKNATKWLEYFTEGVKKSTEKLSRIIDGLDTNSNKSLNTPASLWKLTDRQKKIIEYLENSGVDRLTNKRVQKMFNVSTITASRDLSKMANMGVLLPRGKGRSTYYTL